MSPALSTPRAMFSSTVIASKSEKCWKTMPMPSALAALGSATRMGRPSQTTSPSSAWSTP